MMEKGLIRKSTGSWYLVEAGDGEVIEGRIVGKMRLGDLKLTNPVGVGDVVWYEMTSEGVAQIKKVEPRTNYVIRQSPRKKHHLHLLASNIDQALLIATISHPGLKQGFIDRFLLMTEPYEIPVVIVFNKMDCYVQKDFDRFEEIKLMYEKIGYDCLLVSAKEGRLEVLKDILKDKITLISGQSGVGKSTLINAIQPGIDIRTSDLSDYTGKGQHTTTFAEMFDLDFGGKIIDTPGIKTLSFNHLEVMDVAHNFREIFRCAQDCKYANCTHLKEPQCAVKKAVEQGVIHPWRYGNYLQIIEEIEGQNYWEINNTY